MTDRTPTQRALDAEAQVADLARENERLREALRKISGMKSEPIGDTGLVVGPLSLFNACQRIARVALKGEVR